MSDDTTRHSHSEMSMHESDKKGMAIDITLPRRYISWSIPREMMDHYRDDKELEEYIERLIAEQLDPEEMEDE